MKTLTTLGVVWVVCGGSMWAFGDVVTDQWQPTLHVDWWISGSGEGTLELVANPLDEGRWRSIGVIGDNSRVLMWTIIVDTTSGSPMLDIASLIAKNYSLEDAQFSLTIDLDLTDQLMPNHHLLGDLELILAGYDGAAWVPRDDQWLWQLRADGLDKGGIFENPWLLEVEHGAVTVFGGLDLPKIAAPTISLGFGLDLMLTAGEGAYMRGMIAVPGPSTVLLLATLLLVPRRRHRA